MMANNNSSDVIYVPDYMLDILVQLRHLLELYKSVRKTETELIELLTKEIERISEEGHGNFFIETLINEYEYPRYFDDEQDDEEIFDVDPFTLTPKGLRGVFSQKHSKTAVSSSRSPTDLFFIFLNF
jgi:hypothetical protein